MATARLAPQPPITAQWPSVRSHWPAYDEESIAEVCAILRSGEVNSLHHGKRCSAFERAFARLCEVPFAIAVANGTLALELALRALQIGPGDEVIVPARSFIASASCVRAVGATPIFADIDADTQALSAHTVSQVISERTKALIVVHLAGHPAAMGKLMGIAAQHGLKVVEDCAQAHGATLGGRPVGSFGDIAAFSFCTDKIISTGGEGGMVVTRHADLWRRAWAYKDHGKSPDGGTPTTLPGTFRWLHERVGSNFRLTEMQAAIGLRQLACLPQWLATRRRNAAILDRGLAGLPAMRLITLKRSVGHAYYKYYCFVRPQHLAAGWSRNRIVAELAQAQIPCGTGSCPEIYREAAFVGSTSVPPVRLPVARHLGETSLMLPVDPTLEADAVAVMAAALRSIVQRASR